MNALTYRFLNRTRNFKYPSITYQPLDAETLGNILLTPRERFSLGLDLDVSILTYKILVWAAGPPLPLEIYSSTMYKFSINNTLGASNNAASKDRFFNLFELGADINLRFPKSFCPLIPKVGSKKWTLKPTTLGSTIQTNIGLDKQTKFYYWIGPHRKQKASPEIARYWVCK